MNTSFLNQLLSAPQNGHAQGDVQKIIGAGGKVNGVRLPFDEGYTGQQNPGVRLPFDEGYTGQINQQQGQIPSIATMMKAILGIIGNFSKSSSGNKDNKNPSFDSRKKQAYEDGVVDAISAFPNIGADDRVQKKGGAQLAEVFASPAYNRADPRDYDEYGNDISSFPMDIRMKMNRGVKLTKGDMGRLYASGFTTDENPYLQDWDEYNKPIPGWQ